MGLRHDVERTLVQLVEALGADDAGDPVPGFLTAVLEATSTLRGLSPDAAAARLARVRAALAGAPAGDAEDPAPGPTDDPPADDDPPAEHDPPPPEAPVEPELPADALPLQRELARLATDLPGLAPGSPALSSVDALRGLATAKVPEGPAGAEFFVAAVVLLDQVGDGVRYLPCEAGLRTRLDDLIADAARDAEAVGARIFPAPGQDAGGGRVEELPAFGAAGALIVVERHGFELGGATQGARVRRGVGPAPGFFAPLVAGYAGLVARRDAVPDGAKVIKGFRAWLDGLAGEGADDRATTVRFATTALFPLVALGHGALYDRAVVAAEQVGLFPVPFDPGRLHDEKRYELVLERGAGDPRVVRPGFQGADGMVKQRTRVVADPDRIR